MSQSNTGVRRRAIAAGAGQLAFTHEGAPTRKSKPFDELRRAVLSCLLWEDSFYESGQSIADRIKALVPKVTPMQAAALAIEARIVHGLRHVPLLLVRELARHGNGTIVEVTLKEIVRRPDELGEFLSIYWATNSGKKSIPAAVKRGLGSAFNKFDAYSLAKYDRDNKPVKLRDVMFLTHAKPADVGERKTKWTRFERKGVADLKAKGFNPRRRHEQTPKEKLFEQLIEGTLPTPDTWETALSAGEDKKATFERLMDQKMLGGLAFLRNLRNMVQEGVDSTLMDLYADYLIQHNKLWGILPFQFLNAARMVPSKEPLIDKMLMASMENAPKLAGHTLILLDVSGSMDQRLSSKGDATRIDAAAAVGILAREVCEQVSVFTFSNRVVEVPARRGMALRDAIDRSQQHSGTHLAAAIREVASRKYDRIIVVTDEQSQDGSANPLAGSKAYVVNVASYQNGVAYGAWTRISGWSPAVVQYIAESEKLDAE